MKTFGERIKKYRKISNLSQMQLGKKLGVSFKVISKWENDICLPDIMILFKMSKILNFSIDSILNDNNFVRNADEKQIDVFDIDGQKTGMTATNEEIHKRGLWHKEVSVWIGNKDGQYLIIKRSGTKNIHPNKWAIVAGHVYSGENDIVALTRIIENELNITPNHYNFKYLITERQKKDGLKYKYFKSSIKNQRTKAIINKCYSTAYILRLNVPSDKIRFNTDEISEVKWMSLSEIRELIKTNSTVFKNDDFIQSLLEELNIDLLDIVDSSNNLTGKIEEKLEIHERGYWHRESLIFIGNNKKQILCYKRIANTSVNPGLVVPFFGGHVLTGESYEIAACRELEEEIGIAVNEKDLKYITETKKESEGKLGVSNRRFTRYYFCKLNLKIQQFDFSKNEVDGAFWLDFSDVKDFMFTSYEYQNSREQEPLEVIMDRVEEELIKTCK